MAFKLLIVDDSALMRRQLTELFRDEGDFEIRLARNGQEAVDENMAFAPDVMTLDINMPEMDGLTALSHIMTMRPVPVVMVSSLTEKGALATFEALALGAVDFVVKPEGTISLSIDRIKAELVSKVRSALGARLKQNCGQARNLRARLKKDAEAHRTQGFTRRSPGLKQGLVLVGVSTGGPRTLEEVLPRLPVDFPYPIIVAQHMPASFTGPFAQRMDQICQLSVVEVSQLTEIQPGTIHIARGGADIVIVNRNGRLMLLPKPESPKHLWHPSVEILAQSALNLMDPSRLICVMLTGMGHDGAEAFANIKRQGGRTIAESEDSCVVFGMPKELIERQGATLVLPAEKIANQLIGWSNA